MYVKEEYALNYYNNVIVHYKKENKPRMQATKLDNESIREYSIE